MPTKASGLNDTAKRQFFKWMEQQDTVSLDQVSTTFAVTRVAAKSLIENYIDVKNRSDLTIAKDDYIEDQTFDLNADPEVGEDEDEEEEDA